ncbi:HAD-IIA family hydrolase [Anaerococcus sp. AGMB00486]|uniref:Acid sugar phosphatase n=1 Tax=Anaerococcus faecalis TaxID=2742993 RepID=A0ABX2N985_9FIRM|nr:MULTISPECIES: HAD-IIA family hydrolase [Anaerococcus]MDY3006570.1 HAD-IIA family hydrolase [Anaerococcus porci]NVF11229.1 HAD-IIA family hydrolase [Anaerococcus faecalis]
MKRESINKKTFKNLQECELFILDLDGTIYIGDELIYGAIDFVEHLKNLGKKFVYLTNNSSRASSDYVKILKSMGFSCEKENVFTSGMATGMYLIKRYPKKKVYLVGTEALKIELNSYGIEINNEDADVVVVGYDNELTYAKLLKATHFIRKGVPYIATHPDLVCPLPHGELAPDCGSICSLLEKSTSRQPDIIIGKPNPFMIKLLSNKLNINVDKICSIGDRLYTDILATKNSGAISILVLSGESTISMVDKSEFKPDFIYNSVYDLINIIS